MNVNYQFHNIYVDIIFKVQKLLKLFSYDHLYLIDKVT